MRLLITGASGFLGRRAAAYYRSLGWEVLTPTHAEFDITDRDAVLRWMQENEPMAVLHCAAVSDTGACQREPERTEKINVNGSVNLAAACAKIGAKFIFCSSDQVYSGSTLPGPHRENEPLTPNNVYAEQKLRAEALCAEVCPGAVCLRLSWMYSTESFENEHGHFLSTLKSAFLDESKPISWPCFDKRGITDADEVVRNFAAAVTLPGGIYNFGAENEYDTHTLLQTVFQRLGRNDLLRRLSPNTEAFAASPRDIRMITDGIEEYGVHFSTTEDGLYNALRKIL